MNAAERKQHRWYVAVHVSDAFGLRFSYGLGYSAEEAMRQAQDYAGDGLGVFDIVTVDHATATKIIDSMGEAPLLVDKTTNTATLA